MRKCFQLKCEVVVVRPNYLLLWRVRTVVTGSPRFVCQTSDERKRERDLGKAVRVRRGKGVGVLRGVRIICKCEVNCPLGHFISEFKAHLHIKCI